MDRVAALRQNMAATSYRGGCGDWVAGESMVDTADPQRRDSSREGNTEDRSSEAVPTKEIGLYLSTIEAARKLTDSNLNPDFPEWKENATRVWELRWGELEMVGDKGTREAARRVTYKMDTVRDHPTGQGRPQGTSVGSGVPGRRAAAIAGKIMGL
jgi:hypothetical protein